jgi:hypothetical protein
VTLVLPAGRKGYIFRLRTKSTGKEDFGNGISAGNSKSDDKRAAATQNQQTQRLQRRWQRKYQSREL